MKSILSTALLCLLMPFICASQKLDTSVVSKPFLLGFSKITAFDEHPDSTVYNALQQFWNADLPVSYVTLPMKGIYTKSIERVGELILGEGKQGYIMEGITDLNMVLAQGRRQNPHWQQTTRISFRYAPGIRMTKDNSSNFVPTNQKVGFTVDKGVWDSHTRNFFTEHSGNTMTNEKFNFFAASEPLTSVYLHLELMHFSNGQSSGVYRSVDSARNDYIKGDFSTNYLQVGLSLNRYTKKRQLISGRVGYQRDMSLGGPFDYLAEQEKRYGHNRIIGFLQWRSAPVRHPLGLTKSVRGRDGFDHIINRMWEYRVRWEFEDILGDLSQFKRSSDHRLSWHLFLEGQPLRSRSLGYFFHLFRGRDYFNIRYDDVLWITQIGFSFTFHRYYNPRFHPDEAISGKKPGKAPWFFRRQQSLRNKKIT